MDAWHLRLTDIYLHYALYSALSHPKSDNHIKSGVLLASLVVVEHYLGVVRGEYLSPSHILVLLYVWVDVYHLSISFVSEQQTCLATARVHLEVRAVVGGTDSRFPVVVA